MFALNELFRKDELGIPLRMQRRQEGRDSRPKVSRMLHARLTVGRGVRQWQRAFQRDGRHCPRVKPAPRLRAAPRRAEPRAVLGPSVARARTYICTYVRREQAEVRTHVRVQHFSHTRRKPRQTRITESEPGGRMINASETVDVHQIREGEHGG